MRTVVLGALALGSGCNWVFGLDPVRLTDAQLEDVPIDAPLPTVKLSAITPMLTMSGATTGQATFVPISPPPMVQYGRRGEDLIPTTINGQEVPVGYEYAEATQPWRLVYTLAGGVPHEVHWLPSASQRPGHAVALQLTPNDRDAVPSPAVFRLKATSAPSVWTVPRVYTSNTWTIDLSPPPDGTDAQQINSDFGGSVTRAMAGAKRKPNPTKDFQVLLEYNETAAANACTVVSGSAAFRIDLATGTGTGAAWINNVKNGNWRVFADVTEIGPNLVGANGLPGNAGDIVRYQVITFGPGGAIPLHRNSHSEPGIPLPVPPGILLAKCTNGPDTVPSFGFPSDLGLATMGTIMYATRPLPIDGGPMVQNGASQTMMSDMGPFNGNFALTSFATAPTIDGTSINISSASTVAIPAGGATADLDFGSSVTDPVIDLYEATLYKLQGGQLVPIREFTFTEKPLRFNRATGEPAGTRYVFQIRVIRGASANAVNGDFTVWGNTQTLGVTYTQSFTLD